MTRRFGSDGDGPRANEMKIEAARSMLSRASGTVAPSSCLA
jgi:hypothetical protein